MAQAATEQAATRTLAIRFGAALDQPVAIANELLGGLLDVVDSLAVDHGAAATLSSSDRAAAKRGHEKRE